jgi:hypothetical protein
MHEWTLLSAFSSVAVLLKSKNESTSKYPGYVCLKHIRLREPRS